MTRAEIDREGARATLHTYLEAQYCMIIFIVPTTKLYKPTRQRERELQLGPRIISTTLLLPPAPRPSAPTFYTNDDEKYFQYIIFPLHL